MLRITVTQQSPRKVVLELFGKIAGHDVPLLRQEGQRYLEQGAQLSLELNGVHFVDPDGVAVLRQWVDQDVILSGGSAFLRALLVSVGLESH